MIDSPADCGAVETASDCEEDDDDAIGLGGREAEIGIGCTPLLVAAPRILSPVGPFEGSLLLDVAARALPSSSNTLASRLVLAVLRCCDLLLLLSAAAVLAKVAKLSFGGLPDMARMPALFLMSAGLLAEA